MASAAAKREETKAAEVKLTSGPDKPTTPRVENASKLFKTLKSKDYNGHKKKIHSLAWNVQGQKLASGSVDQTVRVWTIDPRGTHQTPETELTGHKDAVDQLCWHKSNPDLLATASGDKTVRIWDAKVAKCLQVIETKGQNINISWSYDGNYLAVGNKKDVISIIDARKFKIEKEHKWGFQVNEMAWSRNGEFLLLSTGTGDVEILKFPSMDRVHTSKAGGGNCFCLEFDPKGRYLATGHADAVVSLWDLSELVCVRSFDRLESAIRALSFSHDGQYLASVSEDLKIDVSDVETGEPVHTIETRNTINTVQWNPKHMLLAYAGDDAHGRYPGTVTVFGFAS